MEILRGQDEMVMLQRRWVASTSTLTTMTRIFLPGFGKKLYLIREVF